MKDGKIVWQAQCQYCGWKDPEYGTDLKAAQDHAAAHLQATHEGMRASLALECDASIDQQSEVRGASKD